MLKESRERVQPRLGQQHHSAAVPTSRSHSLFILLIYLFIFCLCHYSTDPVSPPICYYAKPYLHLPPSDLLENTTPFAHVI